MKNLCGKTRPVENAYIVWIDPKSSWKYHLLKSNQADNTKPYAIWLVYVEGWGNDIGSEYTSNLLPGLIQALLWGSVLSFDTAVWESEEELLKWAKGGVK